MCIVYGIPFLLSFFLFVFQAYILITFTQNYNSTHTQQSTSDISTSLPPSSPSSPSPCCSPLTHLPIHTMDEATAGLETLKETLRLEIRKELKIKEGAEKLQRASVDRRSRSYVASILKKCNEKLEDLHAELNQLLALVPDDQEGTVSLSLSLSLSFNIYSIYMYILYLFILNRPTVHGPAGLSSCSPQNLTDPHIREYGETTRCGTTSERRSRKYD